MSDVLVFHGSGLSQQGDLIQTLTEMQKKVKAIDVPVSGIRRDELSSVSNCTVAVIRGPWTANPEESLFAELLSHRLGPFWELFERRLKGADPIKLICIGRGALALMSSPVLRSQVQGEVTWDPMFRDRGPWVNARWPEMKENLQCLVLGRAVPRIEYSPRPVEVKEWIRIEAQSLGWHRGPNLWWSLVDPLAVSDRAQLPNYGFEDLLAIKTQATVLKMILEYS